LAWRNLGTSSGRTWQPTDTLAISALRGATLAGKRVPEDVAIVGFGNTEVSAYTQPPLTTVVQEKLAVGAMAVRVVLRRIAQREQGQPWRPRAHVLPTRLLVRESTVRGVERGESGATADGPAVVVA
jgi:LacI family transcriptional regulator